MKKVAIIGGGVAGLTCAQLLKDRCSVTVFEKEKTVGGLIRCERIDGSLFHLCGGHVFNTHRQDVLSWFWSIFDQERDFIKADRHSAVCLSDGRFVDYPIENHVYQLDEAIQKGFVSDLMMMIRDGSEIPKNFGDFLLRRFGKTLYDLYFGPYNAKVWRRDLSEVPLSWLEGKLPMPTAEEMIMANINHLEERQFVHSSFYYEKNGGSQFIADTLASEVFVKTGCEVDELMRLSSGGWRVNGSPFDLVIFCGNLKDVPMLVTGIEWGELDEEIDRLESHGTTAVFCETDPIPYSWFYQPSALHQSHRFICTGNFAPSNNASGKMTCTIEFTNQILKDEILKQLQLMPYHPKYITHYYSPYTYPIQHHRTREMISTVKNKLRELDFYLCGRFAEWEYFNMDATMASAIRLVKQIV